MASRHLSLRIDEKMHDALEAESKRTGESVSEVSRRLIEEGMRMAKHPGVRFRDSFSGREAALSDGPAIWKVIDVFPEWDPKWDIDSKKTLGATSVRPYQVMVAQRYHSEYPDEIDERIRTNRDEADKAYAEWLRTQKLAVAG